MPAPADQPPARPVDPAPGTSQRAIQLLGRRCFPCHTGDTPEGRLRLDDEAGAVSGGRSGFPAVVPGNADESPLIQRVSSPEAARRMPPKGEPLEEAEIALLRSWVEQGAIYPDRAGGKHWHWAYRTPQPASPPEVRDNAWAHNDIDRFILARLDEAGLRPAPPADRSTLLRRVSLDLIGLPPTIAELDAFEQDRAPDAYEKVVERLLSSPHYGERWARVWLDLARYADTNGYQVDNRRSMWPYRDWVIAALNDDMPFDQFTIRQIAGDLLPGATVDDQIATGFLRNTMTNEEGGIDAEEFRVEAIIDRVNTIGTVWLGTTIACAQCHDHKFDPFTQRDYYRLFAFFNNDEPEFEVNTFGATPGGPMTTTSLRSQRREYERLQHEISDAEKTLVTPTPELAAAQAAWETDYQRTRPVWAPLPAAQVESLGGAALLALPDGSWQAAGLLPESDTYVCESAGPLAGLTALRLDVLTGGTGNVGRTSHGNFVLSDFWVDIAPPDGFCGPPAPVRLARGTEDYQQGAHYRNGETWPAAAALDGDPRSGWAVGPQAKLPHCAVFAAAAPIEVPAGGVLRVRLGQTYGHQHVIARFRLSSTTAPSPADSPPLSPALEEALARPATERSADEQQQLAAYYRRVAPLLDPLRVRLAELRANLAKLTVGSTLVMKTRPEPRETFVHVRGNFLDHGERVTPGVPAVLHELPAAERPDRLALGRWLVCPENALVARVTVNRYWEAFFGRGLVETVEDLGTQGDSPTHPELLDALALEFVRGGWSSKAIHRMIVLSATYQQAASFDPALRQRDPYNRLLASGPRFRLEAETIRDSALAASGLLTQRVGGPSVFPPQPDGVWTMIYSNDRWENSAGEDRYRRGLYTFWRRTAPYPSFVSFDAPSREVACARRPRTNTPLQALTTLNDPAFVEAAAALARRVIDEGGPETAARLALAFRLTVARRPTPMETERLTQLLESQRGYYERDAAAATALIASGMVGPPEPALPEVAAWTVVANVLLNLDEFITKS
ncbi:MAG: hypothetical protein CHACPFDD_03583 [Phycisphaerae bacterium]|nr:hypothetical protein [Phycisphaerae bacterium]